MKPPAESHSDSSAEATSVTGVMMNELLARIIEAHGGMDRWSGYGKVEALGAQGSGLHSD
jgi:hypothetical protein